MRKRVCVIGAGISGLCVTYHLRRAGVDVVLLEKNSAVGGNIKTDFREGFLIEHGPNSTLASRELIDMINTLGIADQIVPPRPVARKRYILRDGRLASLPSGPVSLLTNTALSRYAKVRILKEPFIRNGQGEEETVAQFFDRRFGTEVVDYVVDPFVSGIYAGDPQKLSARHAFSQLVEWEATSGSVIKGALFSRRNKKAKLPKGTPRSITFRNGMQTLPDKLFEEIAGNVELNTAVRSIRKRAGSGYAVRTGEHEELFDAIVICTPARAAAELVRDLDTTLANLLRNVYYPPISIVYTGFAAEQVGFDVTGFGFLVPTVEKRKVLGSLWTSSVFENRAPGGHHLFTTFIGGSRSPELAVLDDDKLIETAVSELRSILGTKGDPRFVFVKKWGQAIPQYNIGHGDVLEAIARSRDRDPNLFFCSNFYGGISVSDCVKNAAAAAARVLDLLN